MTTGSHRLSWTHGEAMVLATAAMLAECRFLLPRGPFSPFAPAPWMGTLHDRTLAGHLRELGGDFVCLPFGAGKPVHGPAGDRDWEIVAGSDESVTLALDYPPDSLVERVERRIAVRPDAPGLDFTFTIFARRAGRISVGLHPILRLPERPGRLRLAADFAFGLVHPDQLAPGQAEEFASLAAVPQPTGSTDFSHVPFGPPTEANLQLCGMRGPLTATYLDEGAGIVLDWDRALLPALQIWHSDRSLGGPPWNHRYRGIGLEPIAAAFDLSDSVSTGPNPINARGFATAVGLDPSRPLVLRHSITAFTTGA